MHLIVLVVIALLFFGPSKLPGLGKSLGEAIKGFKDAMNEAGDEADKIAKEVTESPKRTAIDVNSDTIDTHDSERSDTTNKSKTPVS